MGQPHLLARVVVTTASPGLGAPWMGVHQPQSQPGTWKPGQPNPPKGRVNAVLHGFTPKFTWLPPTEHQLSNTGPTAWKTFLPSVAAKRLNKNSMDTQRMMQSTSLSSPVWTSPCSEVSPLLWGSILPHGVSCRAFGCKAASPRGFLSFTISK